MRQLNHKKINDYSYSLDISNEDHIVYINENNYNISTTIRDNYAYKLSQATGLDFNDGMLRKIMLYKHHNSNLMSNIQTQNERMISGMMGVRKILPVDCNKDGYKDLLISLYGARFVYSRLICYDVHNKSILWEKNMLLTQRTYQQ